MQVHILIHTSSIEVPPKAATAGGPAGRPRTSVPASGNSVFMGVGAIIIITPGHLKAAEGMMSVAAATM